jgi:hypothetical protein
MSEPEFEQARKGMYYRHYRLWGKACSRPRHHFSKRPSTAQTSANFQQQSSSPLSSPPLSSRRTPSTGRLSKLPPFPSVSSSSALFGRTIRGSARSTKVTACNSTLLSVPTRAVFVYTLPSTFPSSSSWVSSRSSRML